MYKHNVLKQIVYTCDQITFDELLMQEKNSWFTIETVFVF